VEAGVDISGAIKGAGPGEYVYLIDLSALDVWDNLGIDNQAALTSLRDLSDDLWSRSQVDGEGGVHMSTEGLKNGVYGVVAMDLAGNFSAPAGTIIELKNSSAAENDDFFDVMFKGINNDADTELDYTPGEHPTAGGSGSDISSATVVLELNDVAVGDTVELWADETKVFTHQVTDLEVAARELTFESYDFSAADATTNGRAADEVELVLKVTHGDQSVEDGDVTWKYTW
jgi:hypothetical protein